MELPHVEKFYRELRGKGFGLITVTSDKAPDVLRMVEYNGITHPIVSDTPDPRAGKVYEKYHAYDGKHYLIGPDGTILAAFSKLGISLPILKRELAKHGISRVGAPALPQPEAGRAPARPMRPVHTFSIVARDPDSGEMGAAVQSHWFAVGSDVIWAEAGVGAVATQSFIDPSYGPLGLAAIRAGRSAPEALRGLLAADPNRNVRQVAMIDSQGRVAAYTGTKDIQAAGDIVGPAGKGEPTTARPSTDAEDGWIHVGRNFSVEANLMASDKVWPAMAKAFQQAKGDLAERMLAALDAAQAVGGDIRGRQSAAIIVVKAASSGRPWADRVFDLRVDDADQPIPELRRLVALQRAYNHMNAGDAAVERHDNEGALREYSAAEEIAAKTDGVLPSRLAEMMYWHAVALATMGRVEESLPIFKKAFALQPGWRELTPRLPKAGLLPDDPKLIERIVAQGK